MRKYGSPEPLKPPAEDDEQGIRTTAQRDRWTQDDEQSLVEETPEARES